MIEFYLNIKYYLKTMTPDVMDYAVMLLEKRNNVIENKRLNEENKILIKVSFV